jgi:hypothetical protein
MKAQPRRNPVLPVELHRVPTLERLCFNLLSKEQAVIPYVFIIITHSIVLTCSHAELVYSEESSAKIDCPHADSISPSG